MLIGGKSRAAVALNPDKDAVHFALHSPQLGKRVEAQSRKF